MLLGFAALWGLYSLLKIEIIFAHSGIYIVLNHIEDPLTKDISVAPGGYS
jgi:hypothetical protein